MKSYIKKFTWLHLSVRNRVLHSHDVKLLSDKMCDCLCSRDTTYPPVTKFPMDSVRVQYMLRKLTSLLYLNIFVPLLVKHWLVKVEGMRKSQFPSYLKVNITVHYDKFPGALTK